MRGSPDRTGPLSTRALRSVPGWSAPSGTEPGGSSMVLRSSRAGTAPPARSCAAASTATVGGGAGDRARRPKYTAAAAARPARSRRCHRAARSRSRSREEGFMPEKVRVSLAPARQLSTGDGQAALVLDEDELPEVELVEVEDDDEDSDEEDEELEVLDEASDLAGVALLPEDRLSV